MRKTILSISVLVLAIMIIGCLSGKKDAKPTEPLSNETPKETLKETKMGENPIIVIETSKGTMEIQLRPDKAPKTCENFLKHVDEGFYNGLIFHRVIPNFMIQGGDPEGTGRGGPGYTVPAEITDLKHTLGAVACARLPDQVNPNKESSGSQFYITVVPTPHLDGQYTVFGYVTKGIEVAQAIVAVPRGAGDKPNETIYMTKLYRK